MSADEIDSPGNTGAMPRFALNRKGRDFAVGDIHGCFSDLQQALGAVAFDPQRDRLFSVGDLVDRGPESHLVLQWLDQPWFHAICGNHDLMAWRSALGDPYPAVDHRLHGGAWLEALSSADRLTLGRRLAALPIAMEVETSSGTIGLVHADVPFDDWRFMRRIQWQDKQASARVVEACLWSFERHARRYEGAVRNIRAVVHGHMTMREMLVLGNVYYIDTGGWRPGGRFTLLELHSLQATLGPQMPLATSLRRHR